MKKYGVTIKFCISALVIPGVLCCSSIYAEDVQNTQTQNNQTMGTVQMQSTMEKDKAAGQAFLSANKTKQGVVTLPDGLQYKVIKDGTGNKPTAQDVVTVN